MKTNSLFFAFLCRFPQKDFEIILWVFFLILFFPFWVELKARVYVKLL